MKVTRDVVKDLLPAYLSDEASTDTRSLVEEFLKDDPEFARQVEAQRREAASQTALLQGVNAHPSPDHELRTLMRTRAMLRRERWFLALAIGWTAVPATFFFTGGRRWFLIGDMSLVAATCYVFAAAFWTLLFVTRRRLGPSGL